MQNIFFTSDNHFLHKNVHKFCPSTRGGVQSTEELTGLMIDKWNSMVGVDDIVYCLGDFCFGNSQQAAEILERLNGHINLIRGNHDKWVDSSVAKSYLYSCQDYKVLKHDKMKFILFHYPIIEWDSMHYGSYHLFGHVHGHINLNNRSLDVGIDNRPTGDMGLWHIDEVVDYLKDKPIQKRANRE